MPGKTTLAMSELDRKETASMRPQRNAGENGAAGGPPWHVWFASMRPQRNAGENRASGKTARCMLHGFNEAPAKCRGKPGAGFAAGLSADFASMRPQRNAGENASEWRN